MVSLTGGRAFSPWSAPDSKTSGDCHCLVPRLTIIVRSVLRWRRNREERGEEQESGCEMRQESTRTTKYVKRRNSGIPVSRLFEL